MDGIFKINVAGDILDIRAQGVTIEQMQYEVWKHGELQFRIIHEINADNPGWKLIGKQNTSSILQTLIEEIGYKIDSFYM